MHQQIYLIVYEAIKNNSSLEIWNSIISTFGVIASLITLFILYKSLKLTERSIEYSHSPQLVPLNSYFQILSDSELSEVYAVCNDETDLSQISAKALRKQAPTIEISNIGMAAARDIKILLKFDANKLESLLSAISEKDQNFKFIRPSGDDFFMIQTDNALGGQVYLDLFFENAHSALPPVTSDNSSNRIHVEIPKAVFTIIDKAESVGLRTSQAPKLSFGASILIKFDDIAFKAHETEYKINFPIMHSEYLYNSGSRSQPLIEGYMEYSNTFKKQESIFSGDSRNIF